MYECVVIGSQLGTTVWRGTAFECTSGEISLLHRLYFTESSASYAYGECNNGSIIAQSLSIEDGMFYTSQLNITVSDDVIGRSIECNYDDSSTTTLQLIGTTNVITGKNRKIIIMP